MCLTGVMDVFDRCYGYVLQVLWMSLKQVFDHLYQVPNSRI